MHCNTLQLLQWCMHRHDACTLVTCDIVAYSTTSMPVTAVVCLCKTLAGTSLTVPCSSYSSSKIIHMIMYC
jgi:hypothetical protein